MFTNVNDDAIPFYERLGLKPSADIYVKWKIDWTSFEVGKSGSEKFGVFKSEAQHPVQ